MLFNARERRDILKIIKAKTKGNPQCPTCLEDDWDVPGIINFPVGTVIAKRPVGDEDSVPSLLVVCMKCGYIKFHALETLGIVEGDIWNKR